MTVAEHFERLEYVAQLIAATERRIQAYRDALGACCSTPGAERVSHTRNTDALCDRVAAVVDAERELAGLKEEMTGLSAMVMRWISLLTDPQEITLMTMRYIEGKPNRDIARERNISNRRVQMVIKDARGHIEQRLMEKNESFA